jgi:hypothetical protein
MGQDGVQEWNPWLGAQLPLPSFMLMSEAICVKLHITIDRI